MSTSSPDTNIVRKVAGLVEKAEGDVLPRMVLTTIQKDRVKDRVIPEGGRLENFKRCPSLLLSHSHDALIGRVKDITVEPGNRITALPDFHEETDLSRQSKRLYQLGYLNGISIGFSPLEPPSPLPEGGYEYKTWELLEVTLCPVPANPACTVLRDILSANQLDGAPLSPIIRKSLEAAVSEKAMNEAGLAAGGAAVPPGEMPPEQDQPINNGGDANDVATLIGELTGKLAALIALVKPATPAPAAAAAGVAADGAPGGDEKGGNPFDEEEGEDEEAVDDDPPFEGDEEEDDEEEEALLDRYRRSRRAKVEKAARAKKALRARVQKSYKAHAKTLKEAHDHLDGMASMKPGTPWSKMHAAACKYHHTKMGDCLKALDDMPEEAPPDMPDEAPPAANGNGNGDKPPEANGETMKKDVINAEELRKAIAESMREAIVPFDEAAYRLTGRRISG